MKKLKSNKITKVLALNFIKLETRITEFKLSGKYLVGAVKRSSFFGLFLLIIIIGGCSGSDPISVDVFRGNPIKGNVNGVITLAGSPYLVTDTLRVLANQTLTIEPGVELRFDLLFDEGVERAIPFEIYGTLKAIGTESAPITFTSGRLVPDGGDWDGIWIYDATDVSEFEYCRFIYGAKWGRRYNYTIGTNNQIDSTLFDYGCITLFNSSPTIKKSWFLAGGFHGLHCDENSSPIVESCVFYDNAGNGVYTHWTADPVLRYNIISENRDYGVFCRQPPNNIERRDNLQLSYNIVWDNFSGEYNLTAPLELGRITQANANLDSCDFGFNLRLNPAFTDVEFWDFRLTSCSAAIDAGPDDGQSDPHDRIELGLWSYQYRPGEIRRLVNGERLSIADSPYFMSCDLMLPKGQTLTIDPGVEIFIEGRYKFRLLGRLISDGTAQQPVVFSSASESPKRGDWLGLIFEAGGDEGTELRYTTVSYARWGVNISQRDAIIDHCTIVNTDSVGVLCDNFAAPVISYCNFENNAVASILCQFNSSPTINNCTITGGEGYGIYARESSRPKIYNNVIDRVSTNAIRLENLSNAEIINNTFARSGYFGLSCVNNSSPDVINNIFYTNGDELRGGVGIFAVEFSRPVIEYNCFYGHSSSSVSISGDTTAINMASNIIIDPMFVDIEIGNFDSGDPEILNSDNSQSDRGAFGGPGAG
jgi:parallel beta-helix repeat protein